MITGRYIEAVNPKTIKIGKISTKIWITFLLKSVE